MADTRHWSYKGGQDKRIAQLERQGLGAERIHRTLVEEYGKSAVSRTTVIRRLADIRKQRARLDRMKEEQYLAFLKEFYKQHPEIIPQFKEHASPKMLELLGLD